MRHLTVSDRLMHLADEAREFPRAPSYTRGGHVIDLLAPAAADIDWHAITETLARLPRWAARHGGPCVSVAQHCVMGADALAFEKDNITAAAFLVHDAHEACGIGDIATPAVAALDALFQDATAGDMTAIPKPSILLNRLKAAWDVRLIRAVPGLHARMLWADPVRSGVEDVLPETDHTVLVERIARAVKEMDSRMAEAEAFSLFGPRACPKPEPWPVYRGRIEAWGVEKAREEYLVRLATLAGVEVL